jgi:hypothetical protein
MGRVLGWKDGVEPAATASAYEGPRRSVAARVGCDQPLLCLKYSTCFNLFSASFFDLYGPPRFFPFSESTLYPPLTFLIICYLASVGIMEAPSQGTTEFSLWQGCEPNTAIY